MIDFQGIVKDAISNLYESLWPLLLLLLCIAAVLYFFRYDITYSHKKRRQLESSVHSLVSIPIFATLIYLIINQYFILLFLMILVSALYFIYKTGLLDEYIY